MRSPAHGFLLFPLVVLLLTASARNPLAEGRPEGASNEEQWIVSQTALAVVDLARFVSAGSPAPTTELAVSRVAVEASDAPRFAMQIGARAVSVRIDTYVWDPFMYAPVATASGVSPCAQDAAGPDDLVETLSSPTATTLQAENEKISAALAADPTRAANHERAAFLLTTLALREASGTFDDPRSVLSRAAAHLAIAHALRGPRAELTLAGQLADLTLQVLAGRSGPAVRRMDFLSPGMPAAGQAWVRALERRATLDWREPIAAKASRVERLEYVRAVTRMLSVNETMDYLNGQPSDETPDWGWRALAFAPTVEAGHELVKKTLVQTVAEAASILNVPYDGDAQAAFTAALNATPAISSVDRMSGRGIRVIDPGTWGAFYQRHLAHVVTRGSEFYRDTYGSHMAATEFESAADEIAGGLTLWPLVRELRARTAAEYAASMADVVPLVREQPADVPYMAWREVELHVPSGATRISMRYTPSWYPHLFPTGTSFEARRVAGRRTVPDDLARQIDGLHELSPWDPDLTKAWSDVRCHDECTPDEEHEHYSLIADYDLWVMRKFAYDTSDPVRSLHRICDVSVDDCDLLADWLLSRDRFEEAAEAGEIFARLGRDHVGVSNKVEWLVRYYQRIGRTADAQRMAERAASVGSARGLSDLAGFYDRAGDPKRALALYQQIYKRYDNGVELMSFYLRQADAAGQEPDGTEFAALRDRYFGAGGLLSAVASRTRPTRGLRVRSAGYFMTKAGLRRGDIVTAIDGVQVWTRNQADILYDRSFEVPIRYTVWRVDGYVTLEMPLRNYNYSPVLEPYGGE